MTTFDAGSIKATATLDKTDFVAKLREIQNDGERFSSQTYRPKVSLDSTLARVEIDRIKRDLASIGDASARVRVTGGSTAGIDRVRAILADINQQTANASINIDGAALAREQLRAIRNDIREINGKTIRIHVNVNSVDAQAQLRLLQAQVDKLNGRVVNLNGRTGDTKGSGDKGLLGGISGAVGGTQNMIALAIPLVAALQPVVAVTAAAAAGFATLGVAAAGAAAPFAFALKGAITNVQGLNQQLSNAKGNLKTQQTILGNLTPGTKAYSNQLKKVAEAQDKVNKAQAAFTPIEKKFSTALTDLQKGWHNFIKATEPATLGVATIALQGVNNVLRAGAPLVNAVAPVFRKLATDFKNFTAGPGMKKAFDLVQQIGVPALGHLISAAENIGRVFMSMFTAFGPMALGMAAGIDRITKRLAGWAAGDGFQRFLAYVKQVWPGVKQTLGGLLLLLLHIVQAIGPLGPLGLSSIGLIVQLLNLIPVPVLQKAVQLFLIWRTAIMGFTIAMKAWTVITKIIEGVRIAWLALNLTFAVTPIGAIITGIVALIAILVVCYFKVKWFRDAVNTAWDWIAKGAVWLWKNALKPTFDWIMQGVKLTGDVFVWLWKNIIKPTFWIITNAVFGFGDGVIKAFRWIIDQTGKIWGQLKKLVAVPINFVIQYVYDDGIAKLWNGIAGAVGLSAMKLPHLDPVKFAQGGPVQGGQPGKDSVPALMMPGEHVLTAEEVRAAGGHSGVFALRKALRGGMEPTQAPGGAYGLGGSILSGIESVGKAAWGGLTSIGSEIAHLARGALGMVADPILDGLLALIHSKIGSGTSWLRLLGGAAAKPIDWMRNWIHQDDKKAQAAALANYTPTAGVKQWDGLILQALNMLGQPGSWLGTVERRMNQESGGNPRAINNWDSNAKAGTPSEGLMQVIQPTFDAYAGSLRSRGIWDPLANIFAGLNYAIHRYGSLSALNRPGGYARGGMAPMGATAWVGEQGPELMQVTPGGTRVLNHADSMALLGQRVANAGRGGVISSRGGSAGTVVVDMPDKVAIVIGTQSFEAAVQVLTRKTVQIVADQARRSR